MAESAPAALSESPLAEAGRGAADAALARVVGRNVRWRRQRLGLSQAALGSAVGRGRSTVCRWEMGERVPGLPALVALAAALGCAPGDLLANEAPRRVRPRGGRPGREGR